MKVSYCCTHNAGNIIKSHNKKLVDSSKHHAQPCSCWKQEDCPLERKCRSENIIHKCIFSTSGDPDKVYLGTAEGYFKKRYYKHISSFKNERPINKTTLVKYAWEQKQSHDIDLHWNGISSNLCHLILILREAACYPYTKSLKFWPTQTKISYWTKCQNLFLNDVILTSIYGSAIKLMVDDILFNTFLITA